MQAEHLPPPDRAATGVPVEGVEAPDVDPDEVALRLPATIHSAKARPAPPADAMPTELNPGDIDAADVRRRTEDELVVRGERLRAVVELLHPRGGQRREAVQGRLHEHLEVLPVLVEQLELEGIGDLVRGDPRLGDRLEAPDDEPPTSSLT